MRRQIRDRGIALGIAEFFAMLLVAGVIFIALNQGAIDINTAASGYTADTAAQNHIDLMNQIWGLVLFFAVFLAGMFIIARATFESRGP